VLESQDLLDVQSVFPSASVLRDSVDQHRHLWDWRIHPVQQAQFERYRNLREALCPIGLDSAVLNLLRASNDFSEPLALDCRRISARLLCVACRTSHPREEKLSGFKKIVRASDERKSRCSRETQLQKLQD
jgi:hypothetical protein